MKYFSRSEGGSIQGLPKVYYTAHPADHGRFLESLSRQILERENCAVFYDPDPEHPEDEGSFLFDVETMQLIVIPVTSRFLREDCRARREVFALAREKHIPILPIQTEPGITGEFDRVCGGLQLLDPENRDSTAISYEDKLTRFLGSVLIGDELAAKVRAAFDAYIFLSYRKKDRRFAQELMRLIHDNERLRDIAIWYDEFLVPGENYNSAIEDAIKKSELFALVVTPFLVNELNYIMTTEYPLALEQGKTVFPAEMVATDHAALSEHYRDIPSPVDPRDRESFTRELMQALERVALKENDDDPEHNYFIGLAYLGGIDVEKDYSRAVDILTRCASQGFPEAIMKLVDMYRSGEGVEQDYDKAVEWQRRLTEVYDKRLSEERTEENAAAWMFAMRRLGDYLYEQKKLKDAGSVYTRLGKLCWDITDEFSSRRIIFYLIESLIRAGMVLKDMDENDAALKGFDEALELCNIMLEDDRSPEVLRLYSWALGMMGNLYRDRKEHDKALEYYRKALESDRELYEMTHLPTDLRELVVSRSKLGSLRIQQGRLEEALEMYLEDTRELRQIAEELGTPRARRDLSVALNKMGNVYEKLGRREEARKCLEEALELSEKLAEEQNTPLSYDTLAAACSALSNVCDDIQEEFKLLERALSIWSRLAEQCPNEKRYSGGRDYMKERIRRIIASNR